MKYWRIKHDLRKKSQIEHYQFDTFEEAKAKCGRLNREFYENYFKEHYNSYQDWKMNGEPWDFHFVEEVSGE